MQSIRSCIYSVIVGYHRGQFLTAHSITRHRTCIPVNGLGFDRPGSHISELHLYQSIDLFLTDVRSYAAFNYVKNILKVSNDSRRAGFFDYGSYAFFLMYTSLAVSVSKAVALPDEAKCSGAKVGIPS